MTTFNQETIANMFNNAEAKHVNLSELIVDAGTQQRAKVNNEAIENYQHAMENGEAPNFPPIKAVSLIEPVTLPDGTELEIGALILVDGFQRTDAAVKAKMGTFQCETVDGTLTDAIYYSMTANSKNGVNLGGKDYQNAIKKLYTMEDGKWRAHGMKKAIAELLGCSTKSVERATAAIDKATKAEAFKMFEKGEDLQHIADVSYKSLKTIKQWFEEWTAKQNEEPEEPQEPQGTNQEQHQNAGTNNPLDLTFAEVLALKDSALKAKLLKLLMDSVEKDAPQQEEPKQEEPQPEPQQDTEEPEGDALKDLANQWRGQDWWVILGLDLVKLNGMAKPKAAIKRAYNKMLKQCHSDKHGANEALEILKDALAASAKMYK